MPENTENTAPGKASFSNDLFTIEQHTYPGRETWVIVNGQEINPEHPIVRPLLHAMEQASKDQYFNAGHALNEATKISLKMLQEVLQANAEVSHRDRERQPDADQPSNQP